jgi:hypothetical protein
LARRFQRITRKKIAGFFAGLSCILVMKKPATHKMKTHLFTSILVFLLSSTAVPGQTAAEPLSSRAVAAPQRGLAGQAPEAPPSDNKLTRFDLDFPGGRPMDLVAAMEEALGRRVNVIIPTEFRDRGIPSFKVESVTVPALFQAIGQASRGRVTHVTGVADFGAPPGAGRRTQYQHVETSYGFRTVDPEPTDQSVWYFHVDEPPTPPATPTPRVVHFFNLSPYLESGFRVEDSTTAVETAWQLLGTDDVLADLRYHEDTKLLITAGTQEQREIVEQVLSELSQELARRERAREGDSNRPSDRQPAPQKR